jgi:hypothetical protein
MKDFNRFKTSNEKTTYSRGKEEKELMATIINRVVLDLELDLDKNLDRDLETKKLKTLFLYVSSLSYLLKEDDEYIFSFNRICENLDLDATFLRKKIITSAHKKASQSFKFNPRKELEEIYKVALACFSQVSLEALGGLEIEYPKIISLSFLGLPKKRTDKLTLLKKIKQNRWIFDALRATGNEELGQIIQQEFNKIN